MREQRDRLRARYGLREAERSASPLALPLTLSPSPDSRPQPRHGLRAVREAERIAMAWPSHAVCVQCVERQVEQTPTLLSV